MVSFRLNNLAITIEKEGTSRLIKASYPIRFGKYSEIRTSDFEFQFNLKGEIKFIRGLSERWPHPSEFLKRTDGNDWQFYSVGRVIGYKGIVDCMGEYYIPCLPYPSNSVWEFNPYTDPDILQAFAAWSQLYAELYNIRQNSAPANIKEFISLIFKNHENELHESAGKLHSIIGGRLSVLPPDTRHVDYEIVPLMISDGCLYHCDFCGIKSNDRFKPRSKDDVLNQIRRLKVFYGPNLCNYNAVFLGNHDALGAGDELIRTAVSEAASGFGLGKSSPAMKPMLFLFGSVDSLLKTEIGLFDELNGSPFYTYINVGFESLDAATLKTINKPLDTLKIRAAFQKMLDVNRDYSAIEITGNFLLGEQFPPNHNQSLAELLGSISDSPGKKGGIYLSPLMASRNREALLTPFFEIKKQSRVPTYLYLIQRL